MPDLLASIQHHLARVAINASSMRGAGSPRVVAITRKFLGKLPLKPFSTPYEKVFRARLDAATKDLMKKLPPNARRWGRARKALNIFLRDCLYTVHTRRAYRLNRAEQFFELPLDSIIGARLAKESDGALPRWKTVRALTPEGECELPGRGSARGQGRELRQSAPGRGVVGCAGNC